MQYELQDVQFNWLLKLPPRILMQYFSAMFCIFLLFGCNQKSDVEKCVDAHTASLEEKYKNWVKNGTVTHNEEDYKVRMAEYKLISYKECLKAQAGKE